MPTMLIKLIKKLMPHACIGVDVIVGFPGETEEEFNKTINYIKSLPVSYLHVFSYSERDNTLASEFSDIVPNSIRSKRSKILRSLSLKKRRMFYESQLGKRKKVLFESENKKGYIHGFTDNYVKIKINAASSIENTIQMVNILDFRGEYMFGEIIAAG